MTGCGKCCLREFCIGDKESNFYDRMWEIHKNELPQEFTNEIKEHLKRKSQNRKNTDNSDYPPRCYYAVLLYHMIKDKGLDHYTGLRIDWEKAGEGGKAQDAPAIDHIAHDCKAPFKEEAPNKRVPNVAICRNDVNDAKNDLPVDKFIELCEAVSEHHKRLVGKK